MDFTHIANPVRVSAVQIKFVEHQQAGGAYLTLVDGSTHAADTGMLARYTPVPGDYLVRQEDGYEYLNPKDVFERKYRVIGTEMADNHPAKSAFRSRANEDDLRGRALEYASRHYEGGSQFVVQAAEAYYQFLKGVA